LARPTIQQIRQALDDLGLPQVDPSSWFDGTLPEILRVVLQAGRLEPTLEEIAVRRDVVTSALDTDFSFAITQNTGLEMIVVGMLQIDILTANIDEIRIEYQDGVPIANVQIWRDFVGGPFGLGPYNGSDNTRSTAWGAQGLNNIPLTPPQVFPPGNAARTLAIRIISGVAAIKSIRLNATIYRFALNEYNALPS